MRTQRPLPKLWRPLGPATAAALLHSFEGAPEPPQNPAVWREELGEIVAHRLSGLALATCSAAGIKLDDATLDVMRTVHRRNAARVLRLEAAAPRIEAILAAQGIPSVFTKGPALARMYPDPGLRTFGDLDVVVSPTQYWAAIEALTEAGFHPTEHLPPRRFFYTLCREATGLSDGEVSVDLHHRIPPWAFATKLTFDALLADAVDLDLHGRTIRAPSVEHHFVVALLHLFSHLGRPGQEPVVWRDVITLGKAIEPERLIWTLTELELAGLARYAYDSLPRSIRPAVAKRLPTTMSKSLEFRVRQLMPPSIGSGHVLGILFRLPVANAPAFVAAYTFPSQEFIARHVNPGEPPTLFRWWKNGLMGLIAARRELASRSRRQSARPVDAVDAGARAPRGR